MKERMTQLMIFALGLMQVSAFAAMPASQVTQLKQVQVGEGGQIQLLFDSKVTPSQIKTEFVNDIVQLSIQDVAVYPAKIISTSAPDFTKIFAYQYTPKLIRCRVSVKGKADSYQSKVKIKADGKLVTIAFGTEAKSSIDRIATGAAQALRVSNLASSNRTAEKVSEKAIEKNNESSSSGASAAQLSSDEKKILDRIESNESKPIHLSQSASPKATAPSPIRAMVSLAAVLALILGGAYLFKKYGQNSAIIGKMKRNGKMIEVIATQSLGPKRSIAVVKVAGRMLVLGVASESISLISELDSEEGMAPNQTGASFFANLLDTESKPQGVVAANTNSVNASTQRPVVSSAAVAATDAGFSNRVRDRIRNRVEGMKEL